jgi:hypothetical protein
MLVAETGGRRRGEAATDKIYRTLTSRDPQCGR